MLSVFFIPHFEALLFLEHLQTVNSPSKPSVVLPEREGHWKLISSAVEVEAGDSFGEQDVPLQECCGH